MLPQNPKVHWSNPITRGLKICITPGTLTPINLADPSRGFGTLGTVLEKAATPSGWAWEGIPSQDTNPNPRYMQNIPYDGVQNSECTVLGFAKIDDKNNEAPLLTDRDGTGNAWSFQINAKGNATSPFRLAQFTVHDGAGGERLKFGDVTNGQIMNTGLYHVVIARYLGDGLNPCMDLWVDAIKQASHANDSVDGTGFTRATSVAGLPCIGGYYNFLNTYGFKGQQVLAAYWNRVLSDKEVISLSHNPLQIIQSYRNIFIPGKPVVAPADQGVHASEFIEVGIDHNFAKYTPEEGENRLVVVYINLERSDNASGTLIGNGITSVTIGGVEATQVVHNQVKVPEGANYRATISYIGYIKEADIKSGNMYIKYTEDSSPNLEGSAVYCQTLFNVDQTNPVYSIASGGPGEPFTLTIPTIKGGYLVATHSEIQSTARYTFSNLIDKWSAASTSGLMSTSGAAASSQDGVVNITITETTAVGTATANSGIAANFRPVDTTFNHAVRVR